MSITRYAASLAAALLGAAAISGSAAAAPLSAKGEASPAARDGLVQDVRHRRFGGVGIYIGPSYDYGYGYYPRRSYYDDDYYYDRPYRYRTYGRRWTQERFKHPLGRR
jgi:hypothetical protein